MKRLFSSVCVVFMLILIIPNLSLASTGILVDCDKSPAFSKRLNSSVKKLETRLTKYSEGSPPALAIKEQIEQTKSRFDRYSQSSLLCGVDGLPHLITSGDLKHAGEFLLPSLIFLYTTGWIGWSGRKYLQTAALTKKPTEKEIIIDVPIALNIMFSGYLWPLNAWVEFVSGEFVSES